MRDPANSAERHWVEEGEERQAKDYAKRRRSLVDDIVPRQVLVVAVVVKVGDGGAGHQVSVQDLKFVSFNDKISCISGSNHYAQTCGGGRCQCDGESPRHARAHKLRPPPPRPGNPKGT